LASVVTYPELISEVDSTEWIKDLSRPEARLLLQLLSILRILRMVRLLIY